MIQTCGEYVWSSTDSFSFRQLRKTREEVLAMTAEMVAYARSLIEDVEFSAEDALRSDWDFLAQVRSADFES